MHTQFNVDYQKYVGAVFQKHLNDTNIWQMRRNSTKTTHSIFMPFFVFYVLVSAPTIHWEKMDFLMGI